MIDALTRPLEIIAIVVLAYFLLLNSSYLAMTVLAYFALRRYSRRLKAIDVDELVGMADAPPVTLIAPAYNEEATCVEATRALLTLRYPDYDVVVVNDGSTDRTVEVMRSAFDLAPAARVATAALPTAPVHAIYRSRMHPNLWLIDKENGGKADALNVGLNYCRTPVFCAMDADTLLEPDALVRVVRPFFEDRATVAAGGIIRIVNGSTVSLGRVDDVRLPGNLLARMQVLEYLRAFLAGRMAWSALGAMLIISGAFGLFRRETVVAAGGFETDTVGEDMELVVRLHRYCRERDVRYDITFVPDPVAWTECPESLAVLGRQRDRWQRGLAQALVRHRAMLLNPRYGRVGMLAFPYFFFLELIGPAIELLGYLTFVLLLVLGRVTALYAVAFIAVAVVLGMVISIASVCLEELTFRRYRRPGDLARLLLLSLAENFGYRQLSTWWRFRGLVTARKMKWGAMTRKGFTPTEPPPT
jgi:cellulose synthase/poly-beta-1,6-N-acetylglucosamine synthase-like glycosyltransferase